MAAVTPGRRTGATLVVMSGLLLAACGSTHSGFDEAATLKAGLAAQVAGHDAAADADYLAVISHDPHAKLAWYDLGVIAQREGQAPAAQHDYVEALDGAPTYVPALYNLALVETPTSPTTAIGLYERVTSLDPADAAAHYNLGTLLERHGQVSEGQRQITTAETLDPSIAGS